MASTIKLKNGSGAPTAGDLVQGEPALDLTNKRLYTEDAGGTVVEVGTNPTALTIGGTALTATATELNYTDGVTSNIQTQLNTKAPIDDATFTGTTTIPTADINGGTIDGTVIGGSTAAAGTFTTLAADGLTVDGDANFDSGTLFVNASANAVGIGTSSPISSLDMGSHPSGEQWISWSGSASIFPLRGGNSLCLSRGYKSSTSVSDTFVGAITSSLRPSMIALDGSSSSGRGIGFYTDHTTSVVENETVTPTERMRIGTNGDISFYEDTGTTAKFFWDSSQELLLIGEDVANRIGTGANLALGDIDGGLLSIGSTKINNFNAGDIMGSIEFRNIDGSIGEKTKAKIVAVDDTSTGSSTHPTGVALAFSTFSGGTLAEGLRLDSSGNLLVAGTTTNPVGSNVVGHALSSDGRVQHSITGNTVMKTNQTTDGDIVQFRKNGTPVGSIAAKDGDLAIGTGIVGLRFNDASGQIRPSDASGAGRDNAIDLGLSTGRFDDIYATNGTIQTSDRKEKQDIEELSNAEQRVAVAAKGLLRKFRWKDSVEEKGEDARVHFGIIAQDLQDAFEAEGLDAGRYAMFIHSTWTDEETGVECSRMGVRYSELLAFIIAAI